MESTVEKPWPRVAVVGAGAVGSYFGGMLARAGAPVTLIGRQPHVDAINREGLFVDSTQFQERISVSASTEIDAARGADILLFSVKTIDTEATAKSLVPLLSKESILVSLQNGVDNIQRIREAADLDAIPGVVYVAAAMAGPGHVKHSARGDLIIGDPDAGRGSTRLALQLAKISELFARAGVKCKISDAIETDLWMKLIANVACNAVSALGRSTYGRADRNPFAREIMKKAAEETVAVAAAAGVNLPDRDLVERTLRFAGSMETVFSSTAQDIERGKKTEIDSLNGYIARRGAALGIATPVNQTLHAMVKLLEEAPPRSPRS